MRVHSMRSLRRMAWVGLTALLAGCGSADPRPANGVQGAAEGESARAATPRAGGAESGDVSDSPRHGEYVMYTTAAGDSVRAFVVHPESPAPAPGVIVIHEIFGLTDWIRSVADRYAAEGFVTIAPDLLWGRGPGGGGTDAFADQDVVIAAIRELPPDLVKARLDGARAYLRRLPGSTDAVGAVGFGWGGHQSFQYAAEQPELDAAVVFYGSGPEPLARVAQIEAPVLGLYGGDDARVNASIPEIVEAMAGAGKRYEKEIYAGAGHGFLRQDEEGANAEAAERAWPRSVEFLRAELAPAGSR
ncbi:MAG: dienelactone hydrolase family protein [Gemmatimonadota bacterium]